MIEKVVFVFVFIIKIVLLTSFLLLTFYPQYKTSSGLTLGELFKKSKIKYFINGHVHPKNLSTMHNKNGFIELTGMFFILLFLIFDFLNSSPRVNPELVL